jgi:DNA-binding SARP family transcriptional activator/Flp pilus assembly protein TadD
MPSIQLLGGTSIRCDGALLTGPPAQRHRLGLLALLAVSAPQAVSRDRAMTLLWPEHETERSRRLLNLAVHVLRRALGDDVIVSAGDGLLLDTARVECDVVAFRVALALGDHDGAATAWTGPFLDGFHLPESPEFQYWLDEHRAELAHQSEGALLALAESRRAAGDVHGCVGACRRLVAADPYSGTHARSLMLAMEAAGDRAGAIRHAQEHARRLRTELELEPDAETAALLKRLQEGGAASDSGAAAEAAVAGDVVTAGTPVPTPIVAVLGAGMHGAQPDAVGDEVREAVVRALLATQSLRVAATDGPWLRIGAADAAARPRVDATAEIRTYIEDDRLIVALRLVRSADGTYLLSSRLDRPLSGLAALAEEAAESVAAAVLRSPLAVDGSAPAQANEYDTEEARALCAKGHHFCAIREAGALRRAIACFEQALALSPAYAPAHAGLASAYAILGFYDLMAPREAFSLARQSALTARALNPAGSEPHAALGYIAKYYDWRSAERELQTAIQLDPRNALAHQWMGNYLVVRGEGDAAHAAMRQAMRLAPHSAIATAAAGWTRYFAGEHGRALAYFGQAEELDDRLPMISLWRGLTLLEMGRRDEAVAALRKAVALMPGSAAFQATLAHALALTGDDEGARSILRTIRRRRGAVYVPPYEVAKAYLALGERERALKLLESAYREKSHSMTLLRIDPQLRPLHEEPRFLRLAVRVGNL